MNSLLKTAIRKDKIESRQKVASETHKLLSAQIRTRLAPLIKPAPAVVSIYYPVRGEPDISAFMEYNNICLPVMVKGSRQMVFRKTHSSQKLDANIYGIMQPPEHSPICHPDIVIVPMTAFDRQGFRIGYGGGYYDATLSAMRKARKITAIGIAFSFQEVTEIPAEEFDVKLDMIITENEIISFKI